MRVNDTASPALAMLGLPEGKEFTTTVDSVLAGSSTRSWWWATEAEFDAAKVRHAGKPSIFHHSGAALATALAPEEAGAAPAVSPRLDGTAGPVSPRLDGTADRSD
mmetsp:Transcript_39507/g.65273  ORF Transcript_39507/g.65273 Transcript_39507/m.65273 type:complete len:106 (+) Transcript_39507:2-319(+)